MRTINEIYFFVLAKSVAVILLIFVTLIFNSKFGLGQEKVGFNISGNVEGLKDGENLFILIKNGNKIDTVSKSIVKGDTFIFKDVKLPARLGLYLINIQTEFVENLELFLDQSGDVNIKGILKDWPNVQVTGSKSHDEFLEYSRKELKVKGKVDSLRTLISSPNQHNESARKARNERQTFIESLAKSDMLPYALFRWKDFGGRIGDLEFHPSIKWPYYNHLSKLLKNSYYGYKLKEALDKAEKENFMKPGDVFPKITVLDENGKIEQVTDLIKKNKLTLIDCWHSSCKPCRAAFPSIERTLAKYKDKGFGIVGISSDENIEMWKKALAHDKLSWPNYIQIEKSLSKKIDLYGLGAYFLVDCEGQIIAFDGPSRIMQSFGGSLRDEELNEKLEKLLGKN